MNIYTYPDPYTRPSLVEIWPTRSTFLWQFTSQGDLESCEATQWQRNSISEMGGFEGFRVHAKRSFVRIYHVILCGNVKYNFLSQKNSSRMCTEVNYIKEVMMNPKGTRNRMVKTGQDCHGLRTRLSRRENFKTWHPWRSLKPRSELVYTRVGGQAQNDVLCEGPFSKSVSRFKA